MPFNSEREHARNVSNFQRLIAFVRAYEPIYNPPNNVLKLSHLEALLLNAEIKLADVIAKNRAYNNKLNERKMAFADLKDLSQRLIHILQNLNFPREKIENARGFNNKLHDKRLNPSSTVALSISMPNVDVAASEEESYIQQVQQFAELIALLATEPEYAPREIEFQLPALQAKLKALEMKNIEVKQAYDEIMATRKIRNDIFYINPDSLYQVAKDVKLYVEQIYGAKSAEFIHIRNIEFTLPAVLSLNK